MYDISSMCLYLDSRMFAVYPIAVSEQFYVLIAEIEAREACDWLRAAGFPQYAQLFEDMQFPIDVKTVRKDHEFLDGDAIESLFRRLNTLNKCASMKVEISRQRKRVCL
uniref:SAM domain-containing protein n=1 Tax=Aquila chrysaetos chrysaetos TaxID=223781 RepID=A0A663FGU0_AQUCH